MKHLAFPILALLVACGTPQEQCINRNTRDLRTVDRLIAETQGNLDRGYALVDVMTTEDRWGLCRQPDPTLPPVTCLVERDVMEQRAKAIDLAAEATKLEGLKAKRTQLANAARPVIARCKAEYPE